MLGMLYATICSALEDAKAALRLDSSWPKGYYRQGRAYAGLKVSSIIIIVVHLTRNVCKLCSKLEGV